MSRSGADTVLIRCQMPNRPGMFGKLATVIDEAGGDVSGVDLVRTEGGEVVRDLTVRVKDEEHGKQVVEHIRQLPDVRVVQASDPVLRAHVGGKLEIQSRVPLKTRDDLSIAYTPGVARVCNAIADEPERVYNLTIKRNSVAVVTDGSAILGLGNLGPAAALPVMEGKAILFKDFADIDAYPICLSSQDPDTIVATVQQIATVFGGINLEDIAAPACFDIEQRLVETLDIPVMHDDQHGTAVVTVAALRNALTLVGKPFREVRAVVNGVGAAGTAIIWSLLDAGIGDIVACDSKGVIRSDGGRDLTPVKQQIASKTNRKNVQGGLAEAMVGADVFIGVSQPHILTPDMIQSMASDPIVFAMANPVPEGDPEMLNQYARVVATGRSDYPNQINNVLAFPGIFRGALDVRARTITPGMRLAAAAAIARVVRPDEISEEYIVPSPFNREVVPMVAQAVAQAAINEGVARRVH